MYTTSFRKVGGSVMMAIPPALLEALNIHPGDTGSIDVQNGQIVAQPTERRRRRSKYRLEDLLANTEYPVTGAAREWLDAPAVGNELI